MNLSLVLNSGTAPGATSPAPAAPPVCAPASPEMAAFQDFLSLVGLAPLAAEVTDEGLPEASDPDLAALTGNFLPPALPALPPLPVQPQDGGGVPAPALTLPAPPPPALTLPPPIAGAPAAVAADALVQAQLAGLPLPQVTAQQLAADARGAGTQAPPAAPPAAPLPAPLTLAITALPAAPAEAAGMAESQPVLAQLVQAGQLAGMRGRGAEVAPASAQALSPLAGAKAPAADDARVEIASADSLRPVVRAAAPVAADGLPQAAAPVPLVATAVAPQPASAASAPAATGESAPARHDFEAVVDRLAEARELARPGRADLHLTHREFGAVSVQFELAGHALKVAMSSPDQAFAPAVQAALAERPLIAADTARSDSGQPRSDAVSASTAAWQAGTSADGQRGDGQPRGAVPRGVADQPQDRPADDERARSDAANTRGAGRFA